MTYQKATKPLPEKRRLVYLTISVCRMTGLVDLKSKNSTPKERLNAQQAIHSLIGEKREAAMN
jgi:hypothetical protein